MAEPNSISLTDRSLLAALGRWWYVLILCPIVAGLVGYAVVRRIPSVYEATETVSVQPITGVNGVPDMVTAQAMGDTYAEQIHAMPVLQAAATSVGLEASPADLAAMVQARRTTGTTLVNLTVDADDPTLAAQFANAIATTFIAQTSQAEIDRYTTTSSHLIDIVSQFQTQQSADNQQIAALSGEPQSPDRDQQIGTLQYRVAQAQAQQAAASRNLQDLQLAAARSGSALSITDPATPPARPVRPNRTLSLAMAVAAGLFAAVALIWVGEQLRHARLASKVSRRATPTTAPASSRPTWTDSTPS